MRRIGAALLALACAGAFAAPAELTAEQARHLLLRSGFAPAQAEIDQWVGRGAGSAVDEILAQARAAQPVHPPPDSVSQPSASPAGLPATPEERRAFRQQQLREGMEIKGWWMREMIETRSPLAERMALFWHNHFATSQQKVVRARAMWQQHQLLRGQALGNFRALLHGIAHDPAMLVYLDGARNRKEAPNENFAREVMELFTLGEATQGGGYSEHDIREAARAFTGMSIDPASFSYRFHPVVHDSGVKTVFGRRGDFDGDAVIDLLLEQPAAARFITSKLWKEFVSPAPDPREVERIAGQFRASGYDIAVLVRELLLSDAFWADANAGSLIKSPVELVVGTVRQFAVSYTDPLPFVLKCAQLGQNLLAPPNVKGWPGYTDWIDATTLIERKRFPDQVLRARPARMQQGEGGAMGGSGMAQASRGPVVHTADAAATISFDAESFLSLYGGHADREPDPALQARLAEVVLGRPPAEPIPPGTVGVAWLKSLARDATYQLK